MSRVQLFCFTFAGGTAAFFNEIEKDLSAIELVKIEYPGHGERYKESFAADYTELSEDVMRQIKQKYAGGKYGLFGYSMGAITLVEILKKIILDPYMMKPVHVFLAAHEPCIKKELAGFTEGKQADWIKERTIRLSGISKELIHNKPFWRVYLPIFRADYTLIKNYRFEALNLKTSIPATIFFSETDTPEKEMNKWKEYFKGICEFYHFTGNHFFIREYHGKMAQIINKKLLN